MYEEGTIVRENVGKWYSRLRLVGGWMSGWRDREMATGADSELLGMS